MWSIYLSMAEKRKLGEMLVEAGLIDEIQLRTALSDQRQWRRPLGITLVSLGFVSEAEVMRILSDQLSCPVADLDVKIVAPEVIELVPYEIATRHHCLPLTAQRKGSVMELYLAMSDPTDLAVIDDIRFRTGHAVRPVLVGDQQIEEAIQRSYRTGDEHGILKQVTLDDIEDPGSPRRHARPTAAEPEPVPRRALELESEPVTQPALELESEPVTQPALELESEPGASQPLVPPDEPEFVLTERTSASRDASFASTPESQRYVLQALVQLLISEGVIDPGRLRQTIKSIAGKKD